MPIVIAFAIIWFILYSIFKSGNKKKAGTSGEKSRSVPSPVSSPVKPNNITASTVITKKLQQALQIKNKPIYDSIVDIGAHEELIEQPVVSSLVEKKEVSPTPQEYLYPESIRLGTLYKERLNLSKQDVSWLDKFFNPNNVFIAIEGCCIATIHLYLNVLKHADKAMKKQGSSLSARMKLVQESVTAYYGTPAASWYVSGWDELRNNGGLIYLHVFKQCENLVREHYDHRRKLTVDFPFAVTTIQHAYHENIGRFTGEAMAALKGSIQPADDETEYKLNNQNNGRWKQRLERLCEGPFADFEAGVLALAAQNRSNPQLEHIYYEACRFAARHDRTLALTFYVYYVDADLRSPKVDNKQLAKTLQKSLFKTESHLLAFEKIIADLVTDRKLAPALVAVKELYAVKRKKISLDAGLIRETQEQDRETVALLNEYLQEEEEPEAANVSEAEEVSIVIATPQMPVVSAYTVALTGTQEELLAFFGERSFQLGAGDMDTFCQSRGLFKNQLIESINEACYETIDDLLIEETGDYYLLNENYYQSIKNDRQH